MDALSPVAWIPIGILISVEAHVLGRWWLHRHRACPCHRYLHVLGFATFHGIAAFIVTRALAITFR